MSLIRPIAAIEQATKTMGDEAKQKAQKTQVDGKMNVQNMQETGNVPGAKAAFDFDKSRTELSRMGVIKNDGTIDKGKYKEWSDSMGGQAYLQANTAKMTTDKIQKHFGLKSRKEAENLQASISSETSFRNTGTEETYQKNVDAQKEITTNSVAKELKVSTDEKTQNGEKKKIEKREKVGD